MARAVARVRQDVMAVAADRDRAAVVQKGKADCVARVVMVKADPVSAEVDLGAMIAEVFPNAVKHRNLCLRSTQLSFPMKRAWNHWRVR